jgi:hypothetical protein
MDLPQVLCSLLLDGEQADPVKLFAAVALRNKFWSDIASKSPSQTVHIKRDLLQCIQIEGQPEAVIDNICAPLGMLTARLADKYWDVPFEDLGKSLIFSSDTHS